VCSSCVLYFSLSLHDALPILTEPLLKRAGRYDRPALFPDSKRNGFWCAELRFEAVADASRRPFCLVIDALRAADVAIANTTAGRSEEHTSELQSRENLVCRLL